MIWTDFFFLLREMDAYMDLAKVDTVELANNLWTITKISPLCCLFGKLFTLENERKLHTFSLCLW